MLTLPHLSNALYQMLPPELVSAIVSSCPTDSLPILARTSQALQVHAETRLYESLAISTFDGDLVILESIIARPSRSAYVKFLSIDFASGDPEDFDEVAMNTFLECVPALLELRELRIWAQQFFKSAPEYAESVNNLLR